MEAVKKINTFFKTTIPNVHFRKNKNVLYLIEFIENQQKIIMMNENQLLETAQSMFLNNSGRKEVIEFFNKNGINGQEAETMATDAYKAVKEERKEMIQEEVVEEKKGGKNSIIIGTLILLAGIIATMTTDSIWYGAMIVGVISMISGIAKMNS